MNRGYEPQVLGLTASRCVERGHPILVLASLTLGGSAAMLRGPFPARPDAYEVAAALSADPSPPRGEYSDVTSDSPSD
ncbi:hypothetical protein RRF57_002857 [Xylaria bambusicola]|uniref:Uncharacterized protein n=1 Tax=Xylaria bambusicola TaxID=326684 RepID=A0AAN7Z2V1_9PEZI